MYAAPQRDRDRIDGMATFAAAAFLTGMGLVAALARVGAPDRLVEALGPLIALFGLMIIGVATRTARLADFLAARRAVPPIYGGLAFAATAAGLVAALESGANGRSPLPWPAVALGLAGAALIVGPLIRRASATALSDLLATRFPAAPTRWALAVALWVVGVLTATAGFDAAVDVVVAHVGQSRRAAEVVVALALATSVVPGGLKGLLWSDAASAGGALAIAAIGAALAWSGAGASAAPLAETASGWLALPRARRLRFAVARRGLRARRRRVLRLHPGGDRRAADASAARRALRPRFLPRRPRAGRDQPCGVPARRRGGRFADRGRARRRRDMAARSRARPRRRSRRGARRRRRSFHRLRPPDGAWRAVRIARIRLMMLAVVVLAAVVSDLGLVDPSRAIALALALNLALIVPSLVLALVSSGRLVGGLRRRWRPASPRWRGAASQAGASASLSEILIDALIAGAAALLVGAAVGVVAPRAAGALEERRAPRPVHRPALRGEGVKSQAVSTRRASS